VDIAVAEREQTRDEQRDAAHVGGEAHGVGRRHTVDHFGVTETEGQQGESESETTKGRDGASRRDVFVHGGLPSCMCT
jgi:hypothetical protein